jgi:hypothetical protein
MFVGHYGVSYAAKGLDQRIPLWTLFIAVQLVDIVWAILVLLGIERVEIVPGITATNPLDLQYMPYTHSLVASILWAVAAYGVYRWWRRGAGGAPAALLVAVAVLSHWFLDLVVHRPDLPIYDDAMKVGLGLWNFPVAAALVEVGLLFGGIYLYLRTSRPLSPGGRWGMIAFAVIMVATQLGVFFGPAPPSAQALAVTALVAYIAFAGVAAWLELHRRPRSVPNGEFQ